MTELVRVYGENMPRMRFVGRKYGADDAAGGGYGHKWGEWFELGRWRRSFPVSGLDSRTTAHISA